MRDRSALTLLLVAHGGLLAAVVGRGSPWATASIDCVTPTLAAVALGEPAWSVWDGVDTVLGGQALAALAGLPLFALLGTHAWVGKALAILLSMGVVALVWSVLRPAGRGGALLGAAGVAFAPPLVLHASTIFGNWHYSQLVFDYGAAAAALHLLARRGAGPRPVAWFGFGVLVGLGLANSLGSLPFLGIAVVAVGVGAGRRHPRGLLLAGAGLVVGAPPLWGRALGAAPAGDATLTRLFDLRPNLGVLPGLVHPDLPWTLHMHDLAPRSASTAVFTAESAWVVLAWLGVGLATARVVVEARRGTLSRRALWGLGVPLAFIGAFVAACVLLDLRIERLPWRYANVRDHTHRVFPPLLVALAAASGPGWAAAWAAAERLSGRARTAARALVVGAGATLPALGAASAIAIVLQAPGGGPDYRGACFDVAGFAAVGALGPGAATERCEALSTPARRADCLAGAAWGVGYHTARVEGRTPRRGGDDPCRDTPPDLRTRCEPWGEDGPAVADEVVTACRALDADRRDLCFLGVGWFLADLGRVWPEAPLAACDALPRPAERDACWRGPGFVAADHLHSTPVRLAAVLAELPADRAPAGARGAGYSVGRTYAADAPALAVCAALSAPLSTACREGVAEARAHAPAP